jgi:polyisoprenyl-teichoic acid--peptidoglycan teichoic acid transferase
VIAVDFDGFRDIVDAFGGVDIHIKEGFWEHNIYKNEKKIYFKPGKDHLNGEESLAFVRMRLRDENTSYSREERQRQFIGAMLDQAISTETLFKVGQIADILGENVKTDLTATEIYALQRQYSNITSSSIHTLNIDGTGLDTKEGWYYIPNRESLKEVSQKLRDSLEIKQVNNFMTNADTAAPLKEKST